jgi:ribonucleoside-diphosphate reductase alpha chain
VRDLKAAGVWSPELASQLKYFDGDLSQIEQIPAAIRERYQTAFQLEPHTLIDAAARRQKWIDQSQALNLFLREPDLKAMSHMYRHAWHAGLKTTYYLRTLGASSIEKATISARAAEAEPLAVAAPQPRGEAAVDPVGCSIEAMRTGGECEACQ